MQLPEQTEIEALYQQYHTPVHIQAHMRVVGAIAVQIGEARQQLGDTINLPLLKVAGLLHDLVRIPEQWEYVPSSISTPQSHAEINYLILRQSYPELAATIRPHSLMTILQPEPFTTVEQKIVFYADKRVNHDTIVSLTERLQLGQERWGVTSHNDRTAELLPKLQQLEESLFHGTGLQPDHIQ